MATRIETIVTPNSQTIIETREGPKQNGTRLALNVRSGIRMKAQAKREVRKEEIIVALGSIAIAAALGFCLTMTAMNAHAGLIRLF